MQKICLFTDCLGAGGAQRQLVGLAILLKQKGYNVRICTYGAESFFDNTLSEHNISHDVIQNASKPIKRIISVIKYFKNHKPDWIIAYQMIPNTLACVSKLFNRYSKVLISDRGTILQFSFSKRVCLQTYRLANAIVPNCYAQGKVLSQHYPSLDKKVQVIPNFVDLERFHPNIDYQIRNSISVIIVVASLYSLKNAQGLISAIKLVKDAGQKVSVKWYGLENENDSYYKECLDQIKKYKLEKDFVIYPKQQNIERIYRDGDYFCLPSFAEGTPNVICEAMASGLPILCSNICDNAMYVIPGENGFLFDPKNVDQIANSIIEALNLSNNKYIEYCTRSREIAEKSFSETTFIKRYLDIIEK